VQYSGLLPRQLDELWSLLHRRTSSVAVSVASVLPFLPESPRWLLLQDLHEEALTVIARLTGKNVDIHDPDVTAEYLSIKTTIYQERKDRTPVMDVLMFRDKTQNFRRLLLSCGTQFMQQFSGVNALGNEICSK
jgi:Sugar (and other) transporter